MDIVQSVIIGKGINNPALQKCKNYSLNSRKPIIIKFYSYQDNIVLDMFGGSGTTGLVAKKLKRNFILIDNSIEYCKLADKRLEREFKPLLFGKHSSKTKIITCEELKSEVRKVSLSVKKHILQLQKC